MTRILFTATITNWTVEGSVHSEHLRFAAQHLRVVEVGSNREHLLSKLGCFLILVTTTAPKTHQQVEAKRNCYHAFKQLVMAEAGDHAVVEEQQEHKGEKQA